MYGIKPLGNTMTEDQRARKIEADERKQWLARSVANCPPEVQALITSMEDERARSRKRMVRQRTALKQLHRAHIVKLYELERMTGKFIVTNSKLFALKAGAA